MPFKDIIAGKVLAGLPGNLHAARNLLCAGFTPSRTVKVDFESKFLIKERQAIILSDFAKEHAYWINEVPSADFYLRRGGESMVYHNPRTREVIKLNKAEYYATWLEYLDSLALHNILFPDTAYTLEGFTAIDEELHAVLRQPFIVASGLAELSDIREYLEFNGFENSQRNDYVHKSLKSSKDSSKS